MWGHPDQDEGPLAFAEKREPDWLRRPQERTHVTFSSFDYLERRAARPGRAG